MPVFRYAPSCVPGLCTLGKVRSVCVLARGNSAWTWLAGNAR